MDFKARYFPKKIKELKNTEEKVLLNGEILNSTENSFILSDDTGKVEIFSGGNFQKNITIRAFCSVVDGELKLDFLQDISNSDLNLFKKVEALYKKVGI